MTSRHAKVNDNGGRCENCDRPETVHMPQTAYPVLMGGGIGWGTMWLCPECLAGKRARDAAKAVAKGATGATG
jgi:hypothetical protein